MNMDAATRPRRIGELLVSKGVVSEDQVRIALIEQKKNKDHLGRILIRLGFATEAVIRDGLMRDKSRDRREERIRGGDARQVEHRSFRFEVEPAEYLLRAEAHIAEADRAARST